jgi:hypothetical protein
MLSWKGMSGDFATSMQGVIMGIVNHFRNCSKCSRSNQPLFS